MAERLPDTYRPPASLLGKGQQGSLWMPRKLIAHADRYVAVQRASGNTTFSRSHWLREAAEGRMKQEIGEVAFQEQCEYEDLEESED